ncbi:GerAB/ArcD/ProY family transporter [Anaeroselena agilis]|uniref:GerAB/ArcD/ProY family transporter n=1 Tax=Anaeroselena agilis TaxID=3063788 RepID=A0ABU3NSY9_9FIRM|nr:GerAB/ArcD/ProY family transporter [Selenomonadales bacterium 4137-cl]
MSYQPGRMGVAEGIGLTYIVMLPRVFLTSPAVTISSMHNLAWIAPLINWVAALAVLYLLAGVTARVRGDLYTVSDRLLGRVGAWAMAIFYTALFILDAASLLRQFAENTLLTALPGAEFRMIIFWYILFASVLVYFGIEGIARSAYLMLPFIAGGVAAVIILLAPFYDFYRLLPWQGAGVGVAVGRGLELVGLNLGALLLFVLAPSFQKPATMMTAAFYGGGVSALLRTVVIFFFLLAFGVGDGMEKTLPFYEMSRLVYLSRYIQHIEALFIIIWVITGLLAIAIDIFVALYLIARPLGLPSIRPLVPAVAMIVVNLAVIPPDLSAVIKADGSLVLLLSAGVFGGPLLLVAVAYIRKRRKRTWSG